jgi:hypothetical protein
LHGRGRILKLEVGQLPPPPSQTQSKQKKNRKNKKKLKRMVEVREMTFIFLKQMTLVAFNTR